MDRLLRDHLAGEEIADACPPLGYERAAWCGEALAKVSKDAAAKSVRGRATYCLGLHRLRVAGLARRARAASDPAKLEAEAEKLYAELTEKYLPDMKPASIAILCQQLYYANDSEMLLRALYTRDKRDEVRGVACLVLAQVLMRNADRLATSDAKAADAMHKESEKLLEEAADKYADVKTAFDGTVGRKAKSELFDLRHLSVGKAAPEVKGVDQDGKHFKLSDYKGKVVVVDFWGNW